MMRLISLKMLELDLIHAINVVKWDIAKEIVSMMVINQQIIGKNKNGSFDSYDLVVGKWMTNLVATTPITTKAMKSLYAKLNRQKDLKRTYRRRYKDLHAIVATTTDTPATVSHPTVVTSSKATPNIQMVKISSTGQQKKTPDK